jgi:hypothetical protein
MGTNGGSGLGDAGGMMGNNAQPPTTEYTLQGRCNGRSERGHPMGQS